TSWHAASDLTIVNNISVANGGFGIVIGSGDGGAVTSNQNSYIINNIIYGNTLSGIKESSDGVHTPSNNHYYNKLCYGNRLDCISCSTWSQDEVGTVTAHPLFVNSAGDDYHVQPSSPAVDHGISRLAPSGDFDGAPRPQGTDFDIGAFER